MRSLRPWHLEVFHTTRSLVVATALTAVALSTAPLRAQIVTGQVVDSMSGVPVGTGFVVLLDSNNFEVARALSAADGRFRLSARAGGVYRLRSERIGYRAFTSEPFELAKGQTLDQTLRVSAHAIVLSTVEVTGEDRCNTNPDVAEETGLVWQEIRKALAATAWDGTQELARYWWYGYRREWDVARQKIMDEDGVVSEGMARQPFVSLPAAQLGREGFIVRERDSITYNLPDAAVLQDDDFLGKHCFHVVRDSELHSGQIGLAFEPMSRRGLPDVRGALWLDEATSELRVLDVSFTHLPEDVFDQRVGGTVEFLMLPSGAWIVHRWQVRAPKIRVLTSGKRVVFEGTNKRAAITGFTDTGGDVLEITTRDGKKLYPPGVARLSGTVYDSTKGEPLVGALVSLEETPFSASSDKLGVFHLPVPLEGEYRAVLSHPWIDSVGLTPPRRETHLVPDQIDTVSFTIPHARSIARRICSDPADSELAIVVGQVRHDESRGPAARVDVQASWQVLEAKEQGFVPRVIERVARTTRSGSYVLCGVPLGTPVTVSGNGTDSTNLLFPRQEGGIILFARDRDPSQPYGSTRMTAHRTWKVDLLLADSPPTRESGEVPSVLSGFASDSATMLPLEGVVVSLNGSDSTVTRADGTFDMADVEWLKGTNYLVAQREGYAPLRQEIWIPDDFGGALAVSIQLMPRALEVPAPEKLRLHFGLSLHEPVEEPLQSRVDARESMYECRPREYYTPENGVERGCS